MAYILITTLTTENNCLQIKYYREHEGDRLAAALCVHTLEINEAVRTHGVLLPTKCFQQCDTKAVDIAFSMLFGLRLEHTREPCIHFVRKIHEQIEFSIRGKKGKTKKLD